MEVKLPDEHHGTINELHKERRRLSEALGDLRMRYLAEEEALREQLGTIDRMYQNRIQTFGTELGLTPPYQFDPNRMVYITPEKE